MIVMLITLFLYVMRRPICVYLNWFVTLFCCIVFANAQMFDQHIIKCNAPMHIQHKITKKNNGHART